MGPLLVLIFGINLELLPVSGWNQIPGDKILPSLTLGFAYAAYIARLSRGGMLEVLNQDFIRTARAKGLSESSIVIKHAMQGGLLPVVSFLGPAGPRNETTGKRPPCIACFITIEDSDNPFALAVLIKS